METPYWLFVGLLLVGTLGSLGTLIGILITFVKEHKEGTLW